jgi:hypothetical protein
MKQFVSAMLTVVCFGFASFVPLGDDSDGPADQPEKCCTGQDVIENPLCSSECLVAPICAAAVVTQWAFVDAGCSTDPTKTCKRRWAHPFNHLGTCAVVVCADQPGKSKCLWTPNGNKIQDSYLVCNGSDTRCDD